MKETPSQLQLQSYLLNFPFTIDTSNPNNVWMEELLDEKDSQKTLINKPKAYKQFLDLYNFMAGSSLVYLLPSEGNFQDLVYVANLGIYLPHIKEENNIILSNFTSEPRIGEELVGQKFFHQMGYKTHFCPDKWEGEADLKYLYDNVYIGGYDMRSDWESYEWMEETFDMNIIKVAVVDDYLYHLDCTIFPLDIESTIICTEMFDIEELKEIEKHTEIIDVSADDALSGITNSVRMGNMILCSSNISELKRSSELYDFEKHKINKLEKICSKKGMEPIFFNISEYMKSGALLSCMVMHLNRVDHNKILV